MGGRENIGTIEVALAEEISDLVKRALLELLRLRQPENPTLGVERGALPAKRFLAAKLNERIHKPHSLTPIPCRETTRKIKL